MARREIARPVELRRRLARAAVPILVLVLVLLSWSIPRSLDAVTESLSWGLAAYRITLHVALLGALSAVAGVAVWPPRRARRVPDAPAAIGLAVASLVAAAFGGFLTFALGA